MSLDSCQHRCTFLRTSDAAPVGALLRKSLQYKAEGNGFAVERSETLLQRSCGSTLKSGYILGYSPSARNERVKTPQSHTLFRSLTVGMRLRTLLLPPASTSHVGETGR